MHTALIISGIVTYTLMLVYLAAGRIFSLKPGLLDRYNFPPPRVHINGVANRNLHKTFR